MNGHLGGSSNHALDFSTAGAARSGVAVELKACELCTRNFLRPVPQLRMVERKDGVRMDCGERICPSCKRKPKPAPTSGRARPRGLEVVRTARRALP